MARPKHIVESGSRDFFDKFILVAAGDLNQRCRFSARRAASRFVKSTFAAAFAPCTFHIATELSPASGSAEACGSTATMALGPPASSCVRATTARWSRRRRPGRGPPGAAAAADEAVAISRIQRPISRFISCIMACRRLGGPIRELEPPIEATKKLAAIGATMLGVR